MVLLTLSAFFYNFVCALHQCEVPLAAPQSSIADIYNYNANFKNNSEQSSNLYLFNRKKRLLVDKINETDDSSYDQVVNPYPVIWTLNGAIQGYSMGTVKGRRVFAFQGVPYAEPPVGELRFKAPLPKSNWQGILKAQSPGRKCLQGHPINLFRVVGSENCLTLSIYVPMILKENQDANSIRPVPVIVWIHGGSFFYGSGSEYGPAYLLDQDVILVTVNYRLGALGFLSTGDLHSPGNYGLKDQALALKWVHENIVEFGGNPNQVLLMGQSAGGVSANLHAISKKSRKYFQTGFSQSGSAFCHWGVISQKRAQTWTSSLAEKVKCPYNSSEELMKCLRTVPSATLLAAQLRIFDWAPLHPLVVFAPVVEPESPDAFLVQSPREAYEKGEVAKYPWIFSFTSQEGHFELYVLQALLQLLPVRSNLKAYLPHILDYDYLLKGSNKTEMSHRIMQIYSAGSNYASLNAISQIALSNGSYFPEELLGKLSEIQIFGFSVYDEFLGSQCANCSRIFDSSDKRVTKLKENAELSESQQENNREFNFENDVTNFEAICFIYGMSPVYLADKFSVLFNSYSKDVQDCVLELESEVSVEKSKMLTFCSVCGPLFSEMFRINQTFRKLSDKNSFLFKTLNELFCSFDESPKSALVEIDIKTETDSSASEDAFLEDPLRINENEAESENTLFETTNIKEEIITFENIFPDTAEFCQTGITKENPIHDENAFTLGGPGPLNNSAERRYTLRRRKTKKITKYDDGLELSDHNSFESSNDEKSCSDFHDSGSELSEEDPYESDSDRIGNIAESAIGNNNNDLNEAENEKEKLYTTIRLRNGSSKSEKYKYICKKCGNTFFSITGMKSHLVSHDNIEYPVHPEDIKGPPFRCPICKREFQKRDSLKVHCSKVHQLQILPVHKLKPGKTNFHTCSDCGLSYKSFEGLNLHRKKIHGDTLYKCLRCNEGFKIESEWQSHMDSHELETSSENDPLKIAGDTVDNLKPRRSKKVASETDDRLKPRKIKKVAAKRKICFTINESGTKVRKRVCPECNSSFSSASHLRKHKVQMHTKTVTVYKGDLQGPPYKCPECEKELMGRSSLKYHCLKHHNLKIPLLRQTRSLSTSLHCKECVTSFDTFQSFSKHQRVKHNKKYFICVLCDEYFETETDLDSHKLKIHEELNNISVVGEKETESKEKYCEEPYFCRDCNFTFKTKIAISAHLRKCRSVYTNYDCRECPEVFTNSMTLLHHLSSVHNLFTHPEAYKDTYWCTAPKCGEAFSCLKSLQQHLQKTNHESYQITCAFCEKQFDNLQDLNFHKQESHFEKDVAAKKIKIAAKMNRKLSSSYKCRFCDQSFATMKERTLHRQTHPKEEQIFKCTECPKTYTNNNSLVQHLHMVHNDEKFQCDQCGRTIIGIRRYRFHCKAHAEKISGIKPLCDLCGKCFANRKQLNKHRNIVHFKREERRCLICGYVSKTHYYFNVHMEMHARNGKVKRRKRQES